MGDTGILYIASGEQYIDEMFDSVRSVRANAGDVDIAAVVDREVSSDQFSETIVLDDAREHEGIKLAGLGKTPFERTIFLDTDTYVTSDISDVFTLLDTFDVAVAHAPRREAQGVDEYPETHLPDAMPEFNTGVLVYADNRRVRDLFRGWQTVYERHRETGITHDQPSFRTAVYRDKSIRLYVLPPEYNYRFKFPQYADLPIKIIHGRHPEMGAIEKKVNSLEGSRISQYVDGRLYVNKYPPTDPHDR